MGGLLVLAILGYSALTTVVLVYVGKVPTALLIAALLVSLVVDGSYLIARTNPTTGDDAEVLSAIERLRSDEISVRGRTVRLDHAVVRLAPLLATGWRLGGFFDGIKYIEALGLTEIEASTDDASTSPLQAAGKLVICGVAEMQHFSHPAPAGGRKPWDAGNSTTEIVSLSPLGIRVVSALPKNTD